MLAWYLNGCMVNVHNNVHLVCVQFLDQSVSLEGLCTVSSSEGITGRFVYNSELRGYHRKVCVQFRAQSISLEGLCTVPSSECITGKFVYSS